MSRMIPAKSSSACSRSERCVEGLSLHCRSLRCGHDRPWFRALERERRAVQAGDEPPARVTAEPARFVAESRESLKKLHEKLAALGTQLLDGLIIDDPTEGDVASQTLMVASAKAGYDKAVLVREAAEVALKEYQEGTFKHEKQSCETEIKLAKAELESADRAVAPAREHFAKIKQASNGSVLDLAAEWQYETAELSAQLQQKKARFTLETVQSKLKVLLGYTHEKTEKDLKANIEMSRSDELMRRASWELEQSKLKKMQDPPRSQRRLDGDRKRILALLDRAIAIEEPLSARLDQVNAGNEPDDASRKAITDGTHQLREIVDLAQGEADAAALARLKSRLRSAAAR